MVDVCEEPHQRIQRQSADTICQICAITYAHFYRSPFIILSRFYLSFSSLYYLNGTSITIISKKIASSSTHLVPYAVV